MDEKKRSEESRGRGRPKNPKEPPPPCRGILEEADNADHSIEFMYNEPMNFKRIWQIFKGMKSERNILHFQSDKIVIYCKDNRERTFVRCVIDCKNVTSYFCKEPCIITIDNIRLVGITNKIVADYSTIQINRMTYNDRSIQINLNPGNGVRETYEVDIMDEYDEGLVEKCFDERDYMIYINIGWKYFKRITSDQKISTIELVQEHYEDPVSMRHCLIDGQVYQYDFSVLAEQQSPKGGKPCQMTFYHSQMKENDVFHITIRPEYVKAVSHAILNDTIDIYGFDQDRPLKLVGRSRDNIIELVNLIDIEHENRVYNM